MSVYVETVRSWLGQIPEPGARSSDSLAYRTNRKAIWAGNIPEKYERLVHLVPGQRILELRAAEGVLSASAEVRRHAARGSLHLLSARRSCRLFDAVGRHVPNVVLCGNKNRARKYAEAQGNPDDPLGKFNYFATLDDLAPARLRLRSPPSTDQAHRLPIERLTCRR
jgi:hypothetical protein